jgi:hypothetical protein
MAMATAREKNLESDRMIAICIEGYRREYRVRNPLKIKLSNFQFYIDGLAVCREAASKKNIPRIEMR